MSDGTKRYNGWSNYETWCVNLWLTNEEGSYRYWREEAARHRGEGREEAAGRLAEQLKCELEEASPLQEASLYSDLLRAALGEADWFEIAEAFLEDVGPSEDDDQADEEEEDENEDAESGEAFEARKRERLENQKEPLFDLGKIVSTPGALEALTREDITQAMARHLRGDWGDVGRHDWQENDASLREGFRLLSAYQGADGTKFWIITEADRSSTCVLLPSEY